MTEQSERAARIESHKRKFEVLFDKIDDLREDFGIKLEKFREDYVKAPTFVITIVTLSLIISGSFGSIVTAMYYNIDKNERYIFELAKKQVEIEQRHKAIERDNDLIVKMAQILEKVKKEK